MFSERTRWSLEVNELTRLTTARRQRGLPLFDLTESNPTHCGFDYGATLLEAFSDPRSFRYEPDPRGLLSARQAVVAYYAGRGVTLSPEQIFLTSSTSEAYSFIFRLLGNPGDEILAPRPSYPLFDFLTRLNDLQLSPYPLVYDRAWRIDRAALESAITCKSRAILVVHPNNPAGSYVQADEIDFLAGCCAKRQMALIADEVFFDFPHSPEAALKRASGFAVEGRALTFTLSGLSKVSALPQMKCAWMVVNGPPPLLNDALERLEVIADTYLPLSTPVAGALPQFLNARHAMQRQISERLRRNLSQLDSLVAPISTVQRLQTEGGWAAILRLPSIRSDEEWTLRLIREDGVLVHPGHFYDLPAESHVVVSLLPEMFGDAVGKIVARVENDAKRLLAVR